MLKSLQTHYHTYVKNTQTNTAIKLDYSSTAEQHKYTDLTFYTCRR